MSNQNEQSPEKNKNSKRVILMIVGGLLALGLIAGGIFGWRAFTRNSYVQGLSAYGLMDADTAANKFGWASRAPEFFGSYVADAKEKLAEVKMFQDAADSWAAEDYEQALEQYREFNETYEASPFMGGSLDAVAKIPFEWTQQSIYEGDYEGAVEILEGVISGGYPDSVKNEAQSTIPAILLDLGDELAGQGELWQAVEVYTDAYGLTGDRDEIAAADEKIRQSYETLADEAEAAGEIEEAVQVYQALASWLDDNGLPGSIEANTQAAQSLEAWGDDFYSEKDYENAAARYQQVLAFGIDKLEDDLNEKLADATMAWGDELLASGNTDQAVEKYYELIEQYSDTPDMLPFSEEAIQLILAQAVRLVEDGEYVLANQSFEALSSFELSDAAEIELVHNWGIGLYAAGTHHSYLESMRKLWQAKGLAQVLGDQDLIDAVESDTAKVLQTVSELDSGLGELILLAAQAEKYDTYRYPICKEIDSVELCLEKEDYEIVSQTFGLDQQVDLFLYYDEMPDYLAAETPGQAQYFLAFEYTSNKDGSCSYVDNHTLERHRRTTTATIYELATGSGVGQSSFKGGDPPSCPPSRVFSGKTDLVYGPYPDLSVIYAWAVPYSEPGN